MIEKAVGFKVGDRFFPTIEQAQRARILDAVEEFNKAQKGEEVINSENTARFVMDQRDVILDVLTTGPRSRPKARKINKAKKGATPKIVRHEADQFELPKIIEHSETGA